jgi:hypothetical protein
MIRQATNKVTIRPEVSFKYKLLFVGVGALVFIGSLYVSYLIGLKSGHSKYDEDQALIAQLIEEKEGLTQQKLGLAGDVAAADREMQIHDEAYLQMSNAYESAENKNRYLESRLDFYRSIVSPEGGQVGPVIQNFEHSWNQKGIEFQLTLIQSVKHKHQVRGKVLVELYNDVESLGQWPEKNLMPVSFQYYQELRGEIVIDNLPEDAKIKVTFEVNDGNDLERWFNLRHGVASK